MTDHIEVLFEGDEGPLGAEDPGAYDDPLIDCVPEGFPLHVWTWARLGFIAETTRPHGYYLGLLRGNPVPVGLGENDRAPGKRFGGLDGTDETRPAKGHEHGKENLT